MSLLTYGYQTPKLIKSDKSGLGYLSAIQYLSPYKISGYNVCPCASKGCASSCLNTAGRGRTNSVQQARLNRTRLFIDKRDEYIRTLYDEIAAFSKQCISKKQRPAIRLNGTSDLAWEKLIPNLFQDFPSCQFYDYTKIEKRMLRFLSGDFPQNYYLTFSRSENNDKKCHNILDNGGNVVVVFQTKDFPKKWNGYKTYSAETHDLRFVDPENKVGALYAKGKARQDKSGFVVNL